MNEQVATSILPHQEFKFSHFMKEKLLFTPETYFYGLDLSYGQLTGLPFGLSFLKKCRIFFYGE